MGLKARVIATGEIVEVDECGQTFKDMGWDYMDMRGRCYKSEDLDFRDNTPFDYWTRLEHTYAGMAMQGMMNNSYLAGEFRRDPNNGIEDMSKIITKAAAVYAHALVEKYKKEEK